MNTELNDRTRWVTPSCFGRSIDYRCPGCGFWKKFLVFLGLSKDAYGNRHPDDVSRDFDDEWYNSQNEIKNK